MKQVNLEDLMQYKATVQGGNQFLTLPAPEAILSPVFAKLGGKVKQYNCYVQEPTRKAADVNNGEVTAAYQYADRVLIEAVLNDDMQVFGSDRYETVIGVLYAHDINRPIMKMYLGFENQACLNLSVFNPLDITSKDFASTDFSTIYDQIDMYLGNVKQRQVQLQEAIKFLSEEKLSGDKLKEVIGDVAVKAHTSIAMKTHFSAMMDHVFKSSGKYYSPQGEHTRYNLYQAFTHTIGKDREVSLARPDKVLEAYNFFN